VAQFLRDDPELRFDYASNVTGVDWPEKTIKEKDQSQKDGGRRGKGSRGSFRNENARLSGGGLSSLLDGAQTRAAHSPPAHRKNRTDQVSLPSLTPVWRSCEFQEREILIFTASFLRASRFAPHFDVGNSPIIRCARITSNRTITNTNRRRTMTVLSQGAPALSGKRRHERIAQHHYAEGQSRLRTN
jgi:hypothetical protein